MTSSHHRRAIADHERARDSFQGSYCSAVGHSYERLDDGSLQCVRCQHFIGDAKPEQTVEIQRADEGMGGLTAALLFSGGVLFGASVVVLVTYLRVKGVL